MTEKKTLKEVLEQFEYVGNTIYNGKFDDNVLNIFSELSDSEKRILLRSVHNLLCILNIPPENQNVPSRLKKPKLDEDPGNGTTEEIGRLKTWLLKFILGTFVIGCVCTLAVVFIMSFNQTMNEQGSDFFKILKLLF